jgi:hypothetical protein
VSIWRREIDHQQAVEAAKEAAADLQHLVNTLDGCDSEETHLPRIPEREATGESRTQATKRGPELNENVMKSMNN